MTGHFAPPARRHADALPMSSAYFSFIVREYGGAPPARRALLEGTSVSDAALDSRGTVPEITLGQQLQQVRNAARLLEPDWALSLGARLHPAAHGAVGVAAVTAPTLRESLQVMARFSQIRSPHFRLRVQVGATEVRLVPEDRVALNRAERAALLDIVLLSSQNIVESILGRPMREGRFELAGAPPEHAARYRELLHAPVRFDCRQTAIVLPAEWLNLTCPLAERSLFESSLQTLRDRARHLHADRLMVARVEQVLAERGTRLGTPTIAKLIGVSGRTLHRRLRREGVAYRELLEQTNKNRAEVLLRDPELSIAEIADALGYRDAANFGRAFRRWFEQSPGAYRRRFGLSPSVGSPGRSRL